jgi:fluoride exporter
LSLWAAETFGSRFPWGTIIINVSGSLILAVFVAYAFNHSTLDPRLRLLLAVGFCGAYTTFSTYAVESVALLQAGDWMAGVGNIIVTNLICIMSVVAGLALGSRL